MPEHGDYDEKNEKWFCSKWIDKKQWLEIHGYSPKKTIRPKGKLLRKQ